MGPWKSIMCHPSSGRGGKVQFLRFNSPPKQTWGRWWEKATDSKKTLFSLFWNSDLNTFSFQADVHLICADGHWPWPVCLCVSDIKYVRHYPALVLLRHSSTVSLNSAQNGSAAGYRQTRGTQARIGYQSCSDQNLWPVWVPVTPTSCFLATHSHLFVGGGKSYFCLF